MEIKFDVYFKKNLGTLFKDNEVDLNGKHAHTNLQLALVDRLEVNYKVGSIKYTDDVLITDVTENLIQIPFKSDVMKEGLNEFELVAYMKNGDIKTSQTYTYHIDKSVGEGRQASNGNNSSSDGHTHNNLTILNSITQTKINEWDNKANSNHTHNEYANKTHTHNASEIEGLENVGSGTNIDLSNYVTKQELNNKQDKLTSGTNIKTINGQNILGTGNIEIPHDKNKYVVPSPISLESFKGKKLVTIGDSVTAGVGASSQHYPVRLQNTLGMTLTNLGASGTVLCTGGHRGCNIGKLTVANCSNADYVTILMGINDWDQAKEDYYTLGDINTTDTTTIYGAVKMWCDRILEIKQDPSCTKTKFYWMTPLQTSWNNSKGGQNWDQNKTNIHGFKLRDLCQAIIDVADLYEIPVIDLNKFSGIYYNSAEDNNVGEVGGDGIHPNSAGHELIANAIMRAFERNPEYVETSKVLQYSMNYLLSYVAKESGNELSYPVNVGNKAEIVIPVTKIDLGLTTLSLESGKTHSLSATLTPSNTTQTSVIWSSSNQSVAKVVDGLVTAISVGTTNIICRSADNSSIQATITLTVTAPTSTDLTGLTMNLETTTVIEGQTKTLSVGYVPSNTHQTGVTWSTSDEGVATISPNGTSCVVTAVKEGQCYIYATSNVNSSIKAQCFFSTAATDQEVPEDEPTEVYSFEMTSDCSYKDGYLTTVTKGGSLTSARGTKTTALLQQGLGKGQELEVHITIENNPYAPDGGWTFFTVGLDRANSLSDVAKGTGWSFPTPDINIYFDSGRSVKALMWTPGSSTTTKNNLTITGVDTEKVGLTLVFKRNASGKVTMIANGQEETFDGLRGTLPTIANADDSDMLYFIITGFSNKEKLEVKYLGEIR